MLPTTHTTRLSHMKPINLRELLSFKLKLLVVSTSAAQLSKHPLRRHQKGKQFSLSEKIMDFD